jgi:lactoylglutathione lyase
MDNNSTINVKQAVPFFMVSNMDVSLNFYTKGLGFELKNKWEPRGRIEWCWLQLGSASMMLQEHQKTGEPANIFKENKKGICVSINFMCKDAIALYHEFKSKGIDVKEPMVGNGLWEIILNDPDGFSLAFESVTDVPEETKYSDWIAKK